MKENILEFVARHFTPGALDIRKAWKKVSAGHRQIRRPLYYAFAAALAAAAAVLLVYRMPERRMEVPAREQAHTVILPDNSTAVLAPGASMSFRSRRFAHGDRTVRMQGKVFFQVSRDEAHPFKVEASDALVTVLGTQFQVSVTDGGTSVDVVSGKVSFCQRNNPQAAIVLEKGASAKLPAGAAAPGLSAPEVVNPAGWATHTFTYSDTPLESVIKDLESCFGREVRCDATGRRLSGTFRAETLEDAVALIEETLDVKISIL